MSWSLPSHKQTHPRRGLRAGESLGKLAECFYSLVERLPRIRLSRRRIPPPPGIIESRACAPFLDGDPYMSNNPNPPNELTSGTVPPPRPHVVNSPRRPPTAGRAIFASPPPHLAAAAQPPMRITFEVSPELDATIDNMAEKL